MSLRKYISSLAVAGLFAAPALAQPTLTFVRDTTPGGLNEYLFQIVSDDNTGSYAIELAFDGPINDAQTSTGGQINAASTAGLAASLDPGYAIDEDTFYFDGIWDTPNPGDNPFTGTETTGWQQTGSSLFMSFGAGANASPVDVVKIVSSGDIDWSGIIAQGAENFQVSGTTVIPEPAAAVLLGLGGLTLLRRRRDVA